jgi:hypothetical protein
MQGAWKNKYKTTALNHLNQYFISDNFANSWKMVGTYKSCAGDTGASMGHDL